jgi:hypothetical protein
MSDVPLTFDLLFTIPRMASAYARHPDGGARLKVDIEEASVQAANAMLDLMVRRPATIFAAVVVVVEKPENLTELDSDAVEEEPKNEAPRMDLRRAANRRNQRTRGT